MMLHRGSGLPHAAAGDAHARRRSRPPADTDILGLNIEQFIREVHDGARYTVRVFVWVDIRWTDIGDS